MRRDSCLLTQLSRDFRGSTACEAASWTLDTLLQHFQDRPIAVACTPNGMADAATCLHSSDGPADHLPRQGCQHTNLSHRLANSELEHREATNQLEHQGQSAIAAFDQSSVATEQRGMASTVTRSVGNQDHYQNPQLSTALTGGQPPHCTDDAGSPAAAQCGILDRYFALPHEVMLPFSTFVANVRSLPGPLLGSLQTAPWTQVGGVQPFDSICRTWALDTTGIAGMCLPAGAAGCVMYHQPQNDSIRMQYPELLPAVQQGGLWQWALEVFGAEPDAVNLWLGDERSVTSFHKDPYENLYLVVAGEKHFTLLPPCDVHRMNVRALQVAQWRPVPQVAQGQCASQTLASQLMALPAQPPTQHPGVSNGEQLGSQEQLQDAERASAATGGYQDASQGSQQHSASQQQGVDHGDAAHKESQTTDFTQCTWHLELSQPPQRVLWSCANPEDLLHAAPPTVDACSEPQVIGATMDYGKDSSWAAQLQPDSHNSGSSSSNASRFPSDADELGAFQCTVRAGDLLYLPSLWWHHVRQTGEVVAANLWFDMQFDGRYAHQTLVESLSQRAGLMDAVPAAI